MCVREIEVCARAHECYSCLFRNLAAVASSTGFADMADDSAYCSLRRCLFLQPSSPVPIARCRHIYP
jgi:hypothetical protein